MSDGDCPICLGSVDTETTQLMCGHRIHSTCLQALAWNVLMTSNTVMRCPVCRREHEIKASITKKIHYLFIDAKQYLKDTNDLRPSQFVICRIHPSTSRAFWNPQYCFQGCSCASYSVSSAQSRIVL